MKTMIVLSLLSVVLAGRAQAAALRELTIMAGPEASVPAPAAMAAPAETPKKPRDFCEGPRSDAEIKEWLEGVGHLSSPAEHNAMLEACFEKLTRGMSVDQAALFIAALKPIAGESLNEKGAYKARLRMSAFYMGAAKYRLEPAQARRVAGWQDEPNLNNMLIEIYALDNIERLSWPQVKILLDGLRDTNPPDMENGKTKAGDRVIKAWANRKK